ncbi:unnamed protein product [Musa acuminata subsp. malaccensis]|nr:PREDICTED: protein NETWORKED 1A-like isoform X1 [Musa acuminata subsp. malaccensis]XP_009405940.1 PREDICTED: protein NETWORKED 1A-like isoform X1 [Musa acuminata subsp. malaccensis]XP_009405941.1 PREDICTED: protein NETWORKED 1A-like isoform X1 [Musa acuminata subsp. malaccensis]CAG1847408.1 unnamed protein product [Musa acuminata subsp. malaccensis]
MANFSHVEPIHLYSWWGSHISPNNSKWIQENLKGMNDKVKAMIKLIEEDGDSFARRAEMYYKKRPELMNLVEEFYWGYRALAERYEHSTRALRHAHQTMAEAFPNQIPSSIPDESPYGLSGNEVKPHSPEMLLPVRSVIQSDQFDSDAKGSYRSHSEESDQFSSKRGLKQYNEMLATGKGEAHANSSERKVKGVKPLEEESKNFENKGHRSDQEANVKQDANKVIKNLQLDISQLSPDIHVLKDRIMEESKCANNAENEVQSLKGTLSKLNSEKDAALLQYQVSLERISSLELLLSNTQHELKKNSDGLVKEAKKLKHAEELNQSLQLGLDTLENKAKLQEHEINQKQEELEKLQTTLQDKYQQFLEAEMALVSSEKKYIKSQEEAKLLGQEFQKGIEKLRNMEQRNMGLEEQICKLKDEINSLNEQNLHSTLMINGLQDDILLLKEKKKELGDEIRLLLGENKVISQELYYLKEEKNDFEWRYEDLMEKMQAVIIFSESLKAAIKDLQNGNCELKEVCKKYEAERELLVENLKDMDKVSEKNIVLERFLSDANVELEALREKVVALEKSQESLKGEISIYVNERTSVASQFKILSENLQVLSAKNTFLENSLSDASREVEGLRSKVKKLEELCQFLDDQNSGLLAEKYALVSQVKSVTTNLENVEHRFEELMDEYLSFSRERDLMINQVKELGDILKIEKQQRDTITQSYKHLLGTSENQISLLQEENQHKEKELQAEQHNLIRELMENFILGKCLSDLKERNLVLSLEGQKYLKACRNAETLVSKLEQEKLIYMRNIMSLTRHSEKLSDRIHLLYKALNLHKEFISVEEIQDEVCLDIILSELERLLNSASEAESNYQQSQLERSVLVTLMRNTGLDVINLRLQTYSLERELEMKNEELFVLEHEKHELLERNEQVMRYMEASNQREEVLKTEIKVLHMQLADMQEDNRTARCELVKLLDEKMSLSQEFYNLRQQYNILGEEHNEVLVEAMQLDHLYSFFKSLHAERIMELKSLGCDLDSLHVIKNDLSSEISRLNEKRKVLEVEKMHFSDSITYLEEELRNHLLISEFDLNTVTILFEELDLQVETKKNELIEKEKLLSESNKKVKSTQEKNMELNRLLEALQLNNIETKLTQKEMQKKVSNLSQVVTANYEEIRFLGEENKIKQRDIDEMHRSVEVLVSREEQLTSELQKRKSEIVQCEGELTAKLNDIHFLTVYAALQDEKVHEQIVEGEISAMVRKEILAAELSLSKKLMEELKNKLHDLEGENRGLKANLDIYLFMLKSLWDGVASIEEQIMSISKLQLLIKHAKEDMSLMSHQYCDSNQPNEKPMGTKAAGVLLMEKLIDKVIVLQKVIIDITNLLEPERLDSGASSEAARKEVEILKTKALPVLIHDAQSIDKLDLHQRSLESKQEWNKRVLRRLDSDAQRLSDLKRNIGELNKRMSSQKEKLPASYGHDIIKEQLKEAEGSMLELIDDNSRLKMMAKDCSSHDDRTIGPEDKCDAERRQISEQVKLRSEKVGRLELKLQKIQHVLMRIEEEVHENRQGKTARRNRVALRDYLYGRRDNYMHRNVSLLCGCIRISGS